MMSQASRLQRGRKRDTNPTRKATSYVAFNQLADNVTADVALHALIGMLEISSSFRPPLAIPLVMSRVLPTPSTHPHT